MSLDYGLAADELLVGTFGGAYAAPKGTTLPTSFDSALNPAFVGLGFFTEKGPSIPNAPTVTEIRGWQSPDPLAARVKDRSTTVEFELMQWNGDTVPFAFGGGHIEAAGTGFVYLPPTGEVVDEYALVLDIKDGTNVVRFVFDRGYPAAGTSPAFNRDAAGVLSVGFKVLTPDTGGLPFRTFSNLPGWGDSVWGGGS